MTIFDTRLGRWPCGLLAALSIVSLTAGCSSGSGINTGSGPPVLERPDAGVVGDGRLGEILAYVLADTGVPAAAALLVQDDAIAEQAVAGVRRSGGSEAVTDSDLWHLGSLSKSMTATLAAVLVEQGVLDWDTTIGTAFPELVGQVHADHLDVRLDELLSHTGGIASSSSALADAVSRTGGDLTAQRLRFTREVLAAAPGHDRGAYAYSNAGYIVAGAMLERLTGMGWEDLMRSYVFDPLGMSAAGFGPPGDGANDQPTGHIPNGSRWRSLPAGSPDADNPMLYGPAGTVHASLSDVANYMRLHLAGARGFDVPGYLTTDSFLTLYEPRSDALYALGWNVSEISLHHIGSNNRWLAQMIIVPGENVALFVATNAADPEAGDGGAPSRVLASIAQFLKDRIDAAAGR